MFIEHISLFFVYYNHFIIICSPGGRNSLKDNKNPSEFVAEFRKIRHIKSEINIDFYYLL